MTLWIPLLLPLGSYSQRPISTLKTLGSPMVCYDPSLLSQNNANAAEARRLLDHYRPHLPCFNDDVQGTGCVTLAAIMAAFHVSKQDVADLRMVVFGAGTAGVGIADQVRDAIATKRNISQEEASAQIWYELTLHGDEPSVLTRTPG